MLESEWSGFTCVYTEQGYDAESGEMPRDNPNYSMIKGDVLVTNGTSSAGILGHAGIAVSSTEILHIAGSGYHPAKISLLNWKQQYNNSSSKWTKFYRNNNYSYASQAANWGISTSVGSNATFNKFSDKYSTDETYCSKIVWQCYFYGPTVPQAVDDAAYFILPYKLYIKILNLTQKNQIYGPYF